MSDPDSEIRCWRCGHGVPDDLLPVRREEVCPECDADLHVCRLCKFYNPAVSDACDEPIAADVSNKERANFCDYFKPSAHAYRGVGNDPASAERAKLDALFGDSTNAPPDNNADAAQKKLNDLFGLDKDD